MNFILILSLLNFDRLSRFLIIYVKKNWSNYLFSIDLLYINYLNLYRGTADVAILIPLSIILKTLPSSLANCVFRIFPAPVQGHPFGLSHNLLQVYHGHREFFVELLQRDSLFCSLSDLRDCVIKLPFSTPGLLNRERRQLTARFQRQLIFHWLFSCNHWLTGSVTCPSFTLLWPV